MGGRNMKHKDFKPCHLCKKGVMHVGHPLFLRISVDRLGIDANAVQRAHGMELLMGGNARIANVMGEVDPDNWTARGPGFVMGFPRESPG